MTRTTTTARKLFRDVYQKIINYFTDIYSMRARRSVFVTEHKPVCVDLNLNILFQPKVYQQVDFHLF